MIYTHHFQVRASLATVAAFHRRSASLAAITPPPILIQMHRAPHLLQAGDSMDFTMWLGPLPVRWLSRIKHAEPTGFIDVQERGPFAMWVHRHIFVEEGEELTGVVDEVFVSLHETNRLWQLIGIAMWLGLPFLFTYRTWQTRRLLGKMPASPPVSPL